MIQKHIQEEAKQRTKVLYTPSHKKYINSHKKKLKDCKSLDEIEDNDLVGELFSSKEFNKWFQEYIKKN